MKLTSRKFGHGSRAPNGSVWPSADVVATSERYLSAAYAVGLQAVVCERRGRPPPKARGRGHNTLL